MTPNQRARYLYDVLARQPMNPIPMQIIKNTRDALNAKFGTHVHDNSRISIALCRLERTGWVKITRKKVKKFSTTRNEWYEENQKESVFVYKEKQKNTTKGGENEI